jgi:DedD protein
VKKKRLRKGRSRVATVLVVIGLLGLVGGSFGAGVFVALHWRYFAAAMSTAIARSPAPAPRRGADEGRRAEKSARAAEAIPSLTFYRELTAPLSSPAPRPSSAARAEKVAMAADKMPASGQDSAPATVEKTTVSSDEPPAPAESGKFTAPAESGKFTAPVESGKFTVQIAAYKSRSQAEALRETLALKGVGAYVSEIATESGLRYRVRVGPFEDKEAARQKAVRLAAETRLGAFVTSDVGVR